jgi:hypothetical protein
MHDMLNEEDEQSSTYARLSREQANVEERLIAISNVLSPSAS